MLGDRLQDKQLANQSKRLDALEEAQAKSGTSTAKEDIAIKSKLTDSDITSEAGKPTEDKLAILMKQQEQLLRDMALLKVQATASTPELQPTAYPAAPTKQMQKMILGPTSTIRPREPERKQRRRRLLKLQQLR